MTDPRVEGRTVAITIEIDPANLARCTDSELVLYWHVAQANPAPFGDRGAGELVEKISREIVCRWVGTVEPDLWHHKASDYYWEQLRHLGKWVDGVFMPNQLADETGQRSLK